MLGTTLRALELLEPKDRRQAAWVLLLVLIMAVVEAIGIASIMPFLAVLANPQVVETNHYLAAAYRFVGSESLNQFLFTLGGATLALLIGSTLMRGISLWAQLRFTFLQTHSLGLRLMRRYLRQPYHWFFNRHSADFSVLILHEVSNVVQNIMYPAMIVVANTASVVLILAVLLIVDPVLSLTAAAILGAAYLGMFFFTRYYLEAIGKERIDANQGRFRTVHEAFGAVKFVKVTGREDRFAERFDSASARMARRSISATVIGEAPSLMMQILIFGGMLGVLLYLIARHGGVEGALPIVGLYALAGYRLLPALQGLYKGISQIRFALPSLELLLKDVAELEPERPTPAPAATRPIRLSNDLEFRDITYHYPGTDRLILRNFDLHIAANTRIGIVGTTGAGKTTLVDLLLGLLVPTGGQILVDGIAVTTENLRSWQQGLGYVPQSIFLLDDTVAMNIAFGAYPHEIDMVAVERAAKLANLHDFIVNDLPEGYQTTVGEQGIRLSGGQRQRIGIARALYHNPDVIVFDEATSALDNKTELAVMDAVHALAGKKTVVIVAHRLSTVRSCDRILVLDQGRIVADGPYDELLRASAQFRSLVASGR